MTQFFLIVELLLKAIGLWEDFQNYVEKKKIAEGQEKTQNRNDAVDKQKQAKDEAEFDQAQSDIVGNLPKP